MERRADRQSQENEEKENEEKEVNLTYLFERQRSSAARSREGEEV